MSEKEKAQEENINKPYYYKRRKFSDMFKQVVEQKYKEERTKKMLRKEKSKQIINFLRTESHEESDQKLLRKENKITKEEKIKEEEIKIEKFVKKEAIKAEELLIFKIREKKDKFNKMNEAQEKFYKK